MPMFPRRNGARASKRTRGFVPEINGFRQGQFITQRLWHYPRSEAILEDEELSPTIQNFIALTWLRLIHSDLPKLVKQRYGTELRSRTLASIKPEISQALCSLLDELQSSEDARAMRSAVSNPPRQKLASLGRSRKSCPLCKEAHRPDNQFLSKCPFLPLPDKAFIARAREVAGSPCLSDGESEDDSENISCNPKVVQRVHIMQSPCLEAFHGHVPVRLTIDSGATGNMIRAACARGQLQELQAQFDALESLGVFRKPEDIDVDVEYVNPSFLVKKSNGGFRLVTAFADMGRYSKPQPSLMPNVDATLRLIAQWRYIIATGLTKAFYQIPLSKSSMKYCGVVTPFKGVRVYARCAMGMPGSETALEELTCRVLGDLLEQGQVAKIADDLYCGADTLEDPPPPPGLSPMVLSGIQGWARQSFADVGRYSKPQPSLMPNVDATLRLIAQWRYIIATGITKAFYQIPLSKSSMKYCGVVTPFKGVCVYARCAMGMPGSETALEELTCRVLGDLLEQGRAAKIADDLYCGADTLEDQLVDMLHNVTVLCVSRVMFLRSGSVNGSVGIENWIEEAEACIGDGSWTVREREAFLDGLYSCK
ncbi:Retrovirus-related Pol poly from transposon opus [Labeo rohita]|uniref:Retrovirus-related Pol poly from transposon opus n=1 Tax=Labeo rohita TaxID=84645 RepID=A0A498LVD7_LABRO|nr:Retrovirus-related Pol poly from transposon opus [Labeo rohita]